MNGLSNKFIFLKSPEIIFLFSNFFLCFGCEWFEVKKYLTLENKKQIVNNNINKDSQSLESGSLMSFGNLSDADSIMGEINNINQTNNRRTLKNKIYSGKSQYKNSENQNRKVIIDDYSEFNDIKSLGNMDNTLSDLLSIVEKDK